MLVHRVQTGLFVDLEVIGDHAACDCRDSEYSESKQFHFCTFIPAAAAAHHGESLKPSAYLTVAVWQQQLRRDRR